MPRRKAGMIGATALLLISGCGQRPGGPTVAVMPAPNKPFAVFQNDNAACRQYADQQIAGGGHRLQLRYDIAYSQCMYAHGNQVPGDYRPNAPPPPSPGAPPP